MSRMSSLSSHCFKLRLKARMYNGSSMILARLLVCRHYTRASCNKLTKLQERDLEAVVWKTLSAITGSTLLLYIVLVKGLPIREVRAPHGAQDWIHVTLSVAVMQQRSGAEGEQVHLHGHHRLVGANPHRCHHHCCRMPILEYRDDSGDQALTRRRSGAVPGEFAGSGAAVSSEYCLASEGDTSLSMA